MRRRELAISKRIRLVEIHRQGLAEREHFLRFGKRKIFNRAAFAAAGHTNVGHKRPLGSIFVSGQFRKWAIIPAL